MRCGRPLAVLAVALIPIGLLFGCAVGPAGHECSTAACPDDAQITAEVRSLLNQHRELGPPNEVYVRTHGRVVYLSGQVTTGLQRDTAEALARSVAGEREVVDTISLEYSGP